MATIKKKHLEVLKTYKIYIGGQFPRTESGRYYIPFNKAGKKLGNICLSSRKDLRDAIEIARNTQGSWEGRAPFNRGQILYRIAEMLEGRKTQFIEELILQDTTPQQARREVNHTIDRLVYYAGWADKYQQIFSSVNPVSSAHFNFSVCEPMGVVGIIAPQSSSLLGLVSVMAPVIAGGNTCAIISSSSKPLCAVSFAEVLHSSDLPGGVVNILTGKHEELISWMTDHMDVNALIYCENDVKMIQQIKEKSAGNLKRVMLYHHVDWNSSEAQSPYFIKDTQEIKTTWHPIEKTGNIGSKY